MSQNGPFVSAVRSVLVCVRDLRASRSFYEDGLGLSCVGETDSVEADARHLWGIGSGAIRIVQLAKPGDPFGMVELVQWDGGTGDPIRDVARPWDYGLHVLNFATTDIERAIPHLQSFGATFVSPPQTYEIAPGKRLSEVMVYAPGGERHTLLQIGEATPGSAHPVSSPVVTVGIMVPSIAAARAFYGDALGLSVAMETERIGGPFTETMKVPAETRMQMLLLTSGGNWTGKLMLFELTPPEGDLGAQDLTVRTDGRFTGHWMLSLVAGDLDVLAERCREAGAQALTGPVEIDRPLVGRTHAMIIRAPGGVPLEVIEV